MLAFVCFSHAKRDGSGDVIEVLVDGKDDGGGSPLDGEGLLMRSGVEGNGEFDVGLYVGGDVGEIVGDSVEKVGDCFLDSVAITMSR